MKTIKEARLDTGLSQAKAARFCKVQTRTWERWEAETISPPQYAKTLIIEKLEALAARNKQFENSNFYEVRQLLGENQLKTYSDSGGLRIGNSDFSFILPNGYGDGVTRVGFLNRGDWDNRLLDFITVVKGEINIYEHDNFDPNTPIAKTIEGRYGVFSGESFVIFEKWEDLKND